MRQGDTQACSLGHFILVVNLVQVYFATSKMELDIYFQKASHTKFKTQSPLHVLQMVVKNYTETVISVFCFCQSLFDFFTFDEIFHTAC